MEKMKKIVGICGWAVPPEWFAEQIRVVFPGTDVQTVYPQDPFDASLAETIIAESAADWYVGHSLGSLWLMHHRNKLPDRALKILLSPILGFTREKSQGGKTSNSQLQFFSRAIQKNTADPFPFMDFYKMCNLQIPNNLLKTLPDKPTLVRGLKFLSDIEVPATAADGFIALTGENDPLTDAAELQRRIPQMKIVPGASHNPEPLLAYLSDILTDPRLFHSRSA
jgi:hypothetical protein